MTGDHGGGTIDGQPVRRPDPTRVNAIGFDAIVDALGAGMRDFRKAPRFGLFFGAVYALGGILVLLTASALHMSYLSYPLAIGFGLIGPFIAVGLYEVSRRREAGEPVKWGAVLGAIKGKGDEQLIMMGGIVFVAFSFWMIIAHGIFAIFMAESGVGESLEAFTTPAGMAMALPRGPLPV